MSNYTNDINNDTSVSVANLVSKEVSGPQELPHISRFWLKRCFNIKILKSVSDKNWNFFLYNLKNPLYFLSHKYVAVANFFCVSEVAHLLV
jgi:hypothetical protein